MSAEPIHLEMTDAMKSPVHREFNIDIVYVGTNDNGMLDDRPGEFVPWSLSNSLQSQTMGTNTFTRTKTFLWGCSSNSVFDSVEIPSAGNPRGTNQLQSSFQGSFQVVQGFQES